MADLCEVKKCKRDISLYYNKERWGVCETHWAKHCNDKDKFNLKDVSIFKRRE